MSLLIILDLIYSNAIIILISLYSYLIVKEVYSEYEARKKLPPGPRGLPFVGSLPFLGDKPSKTLVKWSKKYGNVFSLQLGTIPLVVLNDWQSIKEAFSSDAVNGRPEDNLFTTLLPNNVTTISGQKWKEQRRFVLYQLRNLGFGKVSMEEHILEEISYLFKEIDKSVGNEVDVRNMFAISVSNNVQSFLFGGRCDYMDENKKLIDHFLEPDAILNLIGVLAFFPVIAKYSFKYLSFLLPKGFRNIKVKILRVKEYIRSEISSHEKTLDRDNFRDYIDSFIAELKKYKNGDKTTFTLDMLEGNVTAFLGAGSGTVLGTIEWMLLVLANYPDVQKRLQQEIDDMIGDERTPKFSDRNQMPYCQSFIWELWRFRTPLPINLPRFTTEETVIQGFKIPKNTQVMANFWALDNDPNLWDNPNEFRADRFLNGVGKQFNKPEYLIPFSYGKRSCPGEALGIVEVFLYLTALLQKYHIKPSVNTDLKLEYKFDFQISPKHKPVVCFTPRK